MNELLNFLYLSLNYNQLLPIVSLTMENHTILIELKSGEKYKISVENTEEAV